MQTNYFLVVKINFQAVEKYFSVLKIYFPDGKIVFKYILCNFAVHIDRFFHTYSLVFPCAPTE